MDAERLAAISSGAFERLSHRDRLQYEYNFDSFCYYRDHPDEPVIQIEPDESDEDDNYDMHDQFARPFRQNYRTRGAKLPRVIETDRTKRLYYVPETAVLIPDNQRRGGCYMYHTAGDLPELGFETTHPNGDSVETIGNRAKRSTCMRNGIRIQGPPCGTCVFEARYVFCKEKEKIL